MNTYNAFIIALGERESKNNYGIVNSWGFMGRWQFGKPRLWDLGFSLDGWHPRFRKKRTIITKKYFLENKYLQDYIMRLHVTQLRNTFRMKRRYNKYLGTKVNGIEITVSGLVAGAHLKGLGGVRKFLRGKDNADALGTKISEYIKKFGGFDLSDSNFAINEEDIPPIRWFDYRKKKAA